MATPAAEKPEKGAEPKVSKKSTAPKAPPATGEGSADSQDTRGGRRTLVGVVASDKMQKTRVVLVTRRVRHGGYGKYVLRRAKYKAHDERNESRAGDKVEIIETRPLSRDKRYRIDRVIERPERA
jgi:small subunit ribosomal protein S17